MRSLNTSFCLIQSWHIRKGSLLLSGVCGLLSLDNSSSVDSIFTTRDVLFIQASSETVKTI